jgi:type II secretory pathway pseudopilin PulG
MVEVIVAMTILVLVLTGVTSLFVSGTRSQADLQLRIQAQTELRIGLDTLRREVHGACPPASATATSITFTITNCTASITWCTQGSGSRYGLYRVVGATCTGGTKWADYLTSGNVFTLTSKNVPANSYSLPRLHVVLTADASPTVQGGSFSVVDDIVFRNSLRA